MRLPVMMRQAEYDPNEAVNDLMKGMLAEKLRPEEIHVRTEETFSLLECFCQKAGIRLIRDEDLDLLDEAKETMLDRFADAEEEEDDFRPDDLIEMLESMSEKEFLSMPGFMIDQIESMVESGMLPESLAGRMRQLLKRYRR